MWGKIKEMWNRAITPYLLFTFVAVVVLAGSGAAGYYIFQGEHSWTKCFLFSVKAITTSGVPDSLKPGVETVLIGFLPLSVVVWGTMLDALITRFRGR